MLMTVSLRNFLRSLFQLINSSMVKNVKVTERPIYKKNMKILLCLCCLPFIVKCQITILNSSSINRTINGIFNDSLYEELIQEPLTDYGTLKKCGRDERYELDVCVPYYNCDPLTRRIVNPIDAFNSTDIRYHIADNQCDHYLDNCCQIPHDSDVPTSSSVEGTEPNPSSTHKTPLSPGAIITELQTVNSTNHMGNSGEDEIGGGWSTCGIRNLNGVDFKIFGNAENTAEYGEFPWQVALLRTNYSKGVQGDQYICGGSIIRRNVIITAAHCVQSFLPGEITVRAGEWDAITTKERIPYQERLASRVILHENYAKVVENNIALILLERPFVKVKTVGTVCLPTADQSINSKQCFISGWQKSTFGREGAYSTILKKKELPMVPNLECQRMLQKTRLGSHFKLHSSVLCAGGEEEKNICAVSGGSPLVCPDTNNSQRYVQNGILSWGIGCGLKDVPGVYTDVSKFRTWIDKRLQELRAS